MKHFVYPSDLTAERAVLGAILFHGSSFAQVGDLLTGEDFYLFHHGKIFEAMAALASQARPIDLVTVIDEMRVQQSFGALAAHGSEAYLAQLANDAAGSDIAHLAVHARLIREKATRRKLMIAAEEIRRLAAGEERDYLERSQQLVFEVQQRQGTTALYPIGDVLRDVLLDLDRRSERQELVTGVPTGFAALDEITAGLQPTDSIVLAARPSMGKTAFALNLVTRAALDHKIPCLVFSVEMSRQALVERMLAAEAQVHAHDLRIGRLNATDWHKIGEAASGSVAKGRPGLAQAGITLNDDGMLRMTQLRAMARRWRTGPAFARGQQLGLVVVDYLQLLTVEQTRGEQNRTQQVAKLSKELKALAKELEVPIVILSQLSRDLEKRQDKRPILADLRDSGAIEQDADVVLFLYRDHVYNKQALPTDAECIVAKQRNGRTGTLPMRFEGHLMRFVDEAA